MRDPVPGAGDLDPDVAAALEGLPPDLDASRGIAAFDPGDRPLPPTDDPDLVISDTRVDAGDGHAVPVRTYRPRHRTDHAGRAVLVLHGGGFISGSPALADPVLRVLSAEVDAVIAAPTYRLAPEDPYPAAFHDARAALRWLATNAADLGADPDRLAVFGVSSGGGLAVALALDTRDDGGPAIARLVLGFPALDDRLTTPSSHAVTDPRVWNRGMAELSWRAYLADLHDTADVPATAAPARATDLSGLPPTTLTVNGMDPLRDEGLAFAERLATAGTPTTLHRFDGAFHGSMGVAPDAAESRAEMAALTKGLLLA